MARSVSTARKQHLQEVGVDLTTAQSLKRALEDEFSATMSSSLAVLEAASERLPKNRFAQSLRDVPLRHLDEIMGARDTALLGRAISGKSFNRQMSGIVAQSGEKTAPKLSVGYRLSPNDLFTVEIRLQHADVHSILYAQTLAERYSLGGVPIGILSKVAAHAGGAHPAALNNDPLTLGSSVAHVTGGPGSLGYFVNAKDGPGFLSCSHVIANCGSANAGDPIHHPASADDGLHHARVGLLRQFTDLRGNGPFAMDAAVAVLTEDIKAGGNRIPNQGWPDSGRNLNAPLVGDVPKSKPAVAKIGRSTGRTTGFVSLENVGPIDIYMPELGRNVTLEGMSEVTWTSLSKPFSDFGDSGSIVYLEDTLEPIGILIAGGMAEFNSAKIGVSYVCPLAPILKAWDLTPN